MSVFYRGTHTFIEDDCYIKHHNITREPRPQFDHHLSLFLHAEILCTLTLLPVMTSSDVQGARVVRPVVGSYFISKGIHNVMVN